MAVGVAVAYVEDVLGLTTQPSEFAADHSRSLLSDSLLGIAIDFGLTSCPFWGYMLK